LLASFHTRWRYSNWTMPNEGIDIPYKLTRNPAIIPREREKGFTAGDLVNETRPITLGATSWGRGRVTSRARGRGRGGVTHGGSEVRGRGTGKGRGTRGGAHGGRGRGRGRGRGTRLKLLLS
jgi:hypothetical protein